MFNEQIELHWTDYLRIVMKRRWLVLSVVLVVTLSTLIVVSAMTPLFTTSCQVLMEKTPQVFGSQLAYPFYDMPSYIETQILLMTAQDFLERVAKQLNDQSRSSADLEKSDYGAAYTREPYHELLSSIRTVTNLFREKLTPSGASKTDKTEGDAQDQEAGKKPAYTPQAIAGGLKVGLVAKTEILQISVTRPDPYEAVLIANAVAETFIKDRLDRRLGSVQGAIQWLQRELKDEQVDLDKSRIELYEFMNKFGILSVDEKRGTKLDEEVKLMGEKVRTAKENTATLEMRYKQILSLVASPNLIDTIPEAMTNKVLGDLRNQEIQLEQEAIKLSATYGSSHPRIMALERQIASLRNAKSQEIQKIVNSLKLQYEAARLQEQSITQARDSMQNELEDLQKRTVRYFTLKREVESNEKVYDVVLNRLKETSLTEEFSRSPSATIIQRAAIPGAPSSPDVQRGLLMGLSIALALGIGLAFLLEYLDNTVSKPEQIEQHLGLTYLGAVPSISLNGKAKEAGGGPVVALANPQSMGAEAYRALRTSILLSSADVPPQVLLVTSPGKSEGKTITAANLAIVLAQAGNRVLIMDCDLRRPKIHSMFGFPREPGLSTMLVGKKLEPQDYIHKIPDINLDVICCGSIPPNPSELLGSRRMRTLLEALRQQYDRIIIDSPPLLVATDSAVLTPVVDGTVLVLKAGETTRQAGRRAVRLMADLNAKVTGAVLNKVMIGKGGYYYYDYYYYLYGGYEEEEQGKRGLWGKKKKHRKSIASDEIST